MAKIFFTWEVPARPKDHGIFLCVPYRYLLIKIAEEEALR
jgi:hypothetical protein